MFLPRISLLVTILALLLTGCGRDPQPQRARLDVAQVVAGTGDVAEHTVQRVRDLVAVELADLQPVFDDRDVQPFFVHIHRSRAAMPAALVAGVHEDAPGFAVLGRHQIHLILDVIARTNTSMVGVVRHELVHELLDQYCGENGRHLPRWFHEGLAQLLAGDTYLGASEEDLVWRVTGGSLRNIDTLSDRFPDATVSLRTAYGHSYSYVAWLVREYGMPMMMRVARYTDETTSFGRALVAQTGRSTLQLDEAWRNYLVYGSGATWRSLFSNWFSLLMILALPVLVLALIRRLQSEERAARRLAQRAES
ncbi:MAG: hypothetical protein KAI24_10605, partial [Planctomycetes bacterium]|nr:hypothetical protein [Planctomycetota bacterium]